MMVTPSIDKALALAAKFMAVQEHRGASEAEAAVAAERLQKLLQEHNLTLSQVEHHAGGEAAASKRVKDAVTGSIWQPWRAALLIGIATNNFCLGRETTQYTDKGRAQRLVVVGREVNVKATLMLYDYLVGAFTRVAKEQYGSRSVATRRDWGYFMDGATSRVIERLDERRREAEAESAARTRQAAGNGTHRELVLSDVYGSEADLNNDVLNGFPAGTTAAKRRSDAERQKRIAAERARLVAAGVDSIEAWYRANGYSEERAVEATKYLRRRSGRRGGRGSRASGFSRRDEAEYRKVNSSSYRRGLETGSAVGLDSQVGSGNPRRLG